MESSSITQKQADLMPNDELAAMIQKCREDGDGAVTTVVHGAPDTDEQRVISIDTEVERSWREAENLGWHRSWEALRTGVARAQLAGTLTKKEAQEQIVAWINSKLLLIVSEVCEAQDELRKGHSITDVYYSDEHTASTGEVAVDQQYTEDGRPKLKPEGFLVELADAMIRIEDLVGVVTEGEPSFGQIKLDKLAFNATRGQMHGGKAF